MDVPVKQICFGANGLIDADEELVVAELVAC